ncbi:DUF3846 domain-containing protein [Rhodococcus jostii]|uniref:DUF3846 domain-containing protein n=1 Tax=Rhodococcus jostii TaxID=132919 RepID=UPI003654C64A
MNDTRTQTTVIAQAVQIGVDGCLEVIDLGARESTGAALRSAIGCCWFDVVRLTDELDMWIDDEGAIVADAEVNLMATAIARAHGAIWQPFCGVVVFAAHDGNGATVGLSDAQRDALLTGAVFVPTVNH